MINKESVEKLLKLTNCMPSDIKKENNNVICNEDHKWEDGSEVSKDEMLIDETWDCVAEWMVEARNILPELLKSYIEKHADPNRAELAKKAEKMMELEANLPPETWELWDHFDSDDPSINHMNGYKASGRFSGNKASHSTTREECEFFVYARNNISHIANGALALAQRVEELEGQLEERVSKEDTPGTQAWGHKILGGGRVDDYFNLNEYVRQAKGSNIIGNIDAVGAPLPKYFGEPPYWIDDND